MGKLAWKKIAVAAMVLGCFSLSLTSCGEPEVGPEGPAGPMGPEGPQGEPGKDGSNGADGQDGQDGQDGHDGADGLSAYELYCLAHPEYQGTEEEWLSDLVNGNLADKAVYTVSFDSQGGTPVEPQQVGWLGKAAKPTDPVKEGYTFDGWWYEGEQWSFVGYVVTSDMTLTAHWEANEYTVALDSEGGSIDGPSSVLLTYGEEFELPSPTKAEKVFLYWAHDGAPLPDGPWGIAEDCTLSAVYADETYTVTYDYGYDGLSEEQTVGFRELWTLLRPTRHGYDLVGFNDDEGNPFEPTSRYEIVGDLTLHAVWEPHETVLSFDEIEEPFSVKFGELTCLPVPSKESGGIPFVGWRYDNADDHTVRIITTDENGFMDEPWEIDLPSVSLKAVYGYRISDLGEMYDKYVDSSSPAFVLTNDVVVDGLPYYWPNSDYPHHATLYGNGHYVSGTIKVDKRNYILKGITRLGLFQSISCGYIFGLYFKDFHLEFEDGAEIKYVGLLAGQAIYLEMHDVKVLSGCTLPFIEDVDTCPISYSGGLIGYSSDDIRAYYCSVEMKFGGMGGMVGFLETETYSSFYGCTFKGGGKLLGGLVGCSLGSGVRFYSCTNYGTIVAPFSKSYVGGLLGAGKNKVTMSDCHNYGNVYGGAYVSTANGPTGGLVGLCYGELEVDDCTNESECVGYDDNAFDYVQDTSLPESEYPDGESDFCGSTYIETLFDGYDLGHASIGGIVGLVRGPGHLKNCQNSADIYNIIPDNAWIMEACCGGMVGEYQSHSVRNGSVITYYYGQINNCQNYGRIVGSGTLGGICGYFIGKLADSTNKGKLIIDDDRYNASDSDSYLRIGGICGLYSMCSGTISGCNNYGNITFYKGLYIYCGGLFGSFSKFSAYASDKIIVKNCNSFGNVSFQTSCRCALGKAFGYLYVSSDAYCYFADCALNLSFSEHDDVTLVMEDDQLVGDGSTRYEIL